MKILVDHGSSHNLGDTAMIEGAVRSLLDAVPGSEAHVVDRPGLRTGLWAWDRVHPAPEPRVVRPATRARDLGLHRRWPYRAPGVRALSWRACNPLAPGNAADRALLAGGFRRLGRSLRAGRVVVADASGERTLDEWCRPYDAYYVVGGGNLTDAFEELVWLRCCLIHAFADRGKPVVLTGQQIGPWAGRAAERATARALGRARFVGLREPTDSLEFCRRHGLEPGRFGVTGDDSFGLPPAPPADAEALLRRHGLEPGRFLAANVRIARYSGDCDARLGEFAEAAGALAARRGMPVAVVPIALNDADSDVASGRRLADAAGGAPVRVIDDPGLTPGLAKAVLARAHGAFGVSYHFCTFALSQGVPAVCVHRGDYYGQKGRGLAEFWGDPRLSVALGGGGGRLAGHIAGVLDDRGLRGRLARRAVEAAGAWRSALQGLFSGIATAEVAP